MIPVNGACPGYTLAQVGSVLAVTIGVLLTTFSASNSSSPASVSGASRVGVFIRNRYYLVLLEETPRKNKNITVARKFGEICLQQTPTIGTDGMYVMG
jgi:hypothetical protein